MKFISKLSLSLLAISVSAASFADPITVYGKANISAQAADEGAGSFTEIKSNASRFGVKGDLKLDNDMEVLYTFEWQVDLADESGSDNIKARNQYVGLKGSFGTVLLGRNDTVLKQSQGKIDQFSDYEADIKGLWKGENRMGDSVTYISPTANGFSLGLTYVAEDDVAGDDSQSISLTYGDKALKKDKWFASVAADFDMKGYDSQRFSVQGKFDQLTLGAILHRQESVETGSSKNGVMMSAAYTIGKLVLKGQYQTLEDDNSATIGADYKLGKSTKAFIWYTDRGLDKSEDKSWLALGLEHKF
ncbi:porin [Aliiglaciecola litoralis]|uniref:Porin n=1 Tax=Aliiglaciecola litoralis TaxID=582857 RepID=A0ABN1LF35_9ALTE